MTCDHLTKAFGLKILKIKSTFILKSVTNQYIYLHFLNQLTLTQLITSKSTLFPKNPLFEASDNIQSSLWTNHEDVGYVTECHSQWLAS